MKQITILICSGFIFLTSCNQAPTTTATETKDSVPVFDIVAAKAAIADANKAFCEAAMKGDSNALAASYASGAHMLMPNMPAIVDAPGIAGATAGLAKEKIPDFKLETVDIFGNQDNVIEEGRYTMTDGKGKTLDQGKYLVVWRQENGKWKLYRDIFNSDMPMKKSK